MFIELISNTLHKMIKKCNALGVWKKKKPIAF